MKKSRKKQTVFVGMSGGVDSSVTAALLQKQGYEVVGVFIKVWSPPGYPCTWREDRRDAMRVAAQLDIPLITLDLEKEYKAGVVDYMLREYRAGRTPNPDVMCNREVKFGAFLRYALKMKADYIATGHYVRREGNSLLQARDESKDQSYFLWTLTQAEIKRCLFPIGEYEKSEVRKLAKKLGLYTAEKRDSQGLCFIGKLDVKDFLKKHIKEKRGRVLDEDGGEIGWHNGAWFYTLGERHGFTITIKTPHDAPYYVMAKDVERNILIVSQRRVTSVPPTKIIKLEQVNWILGVPDPAKIYQAQVRYHGLSSLCRIEEKNTETFVHFDHLAEPASPGQSLVIYDGEVMMGGGVISC